MQNTQRLHGPRPRAHPESVRSVLITAWHDLKSTVLFSAKISPPLLFPTQGVLCPPIPICTDGPWATGWVPPSVLVLFSPQGLHVGLRDLLGFMLTFSHPFPGGSPGPTSCLSQPGPGRRQQAPVGSGPVLRGSPQPLPQIQQPVQLCCRLRLAAQALRLLPVSSGPPPSWSCQSLCKMRMIKAFPPRLAVNADNMCYSAYWRPCDQ